jgi:hypothetical protein
VSTTEVINASYFLNFILYILLYLCVQITKVIATATDSISDVAVYGVSVNGYDGKVCFATIRICIMNPDLF